jgi:hypothetical protein
MAMSSTTNFTVDDSDIGDTCLFALVEAKMKDMAQVVEALNGEDEECGGNSARFPSTFEIRSTFFYKATADVEIDVEIDEVACIKAIRTNIAKCRRGDLSWSYSVGSGLWCRRCGTVPASFVEKFPKETTETVEKAIQEICCVLN